MSHLVFPKCLHPDSMIFCDHRFPLESHDINSFSNPVFNMSKNIYPA